MKISVLILSIFVVIFITIPELSLASFTAPDVDLPAKGAIPENSGLFEGTSLIDVIVIIINWVLGFVGIIIFIIFLYAGFEYATAGGEQSKAESAQSRMANAVIGLIIIFFAFVASNAVLGFVFPADDTVDDINIPLNAN